MGSSNWQVGAILKEPLYVTLGFIAWHLDLGADRITIFFDDCEDAAIPLVAPHNQVRAIRCSEIFWKRLGIYDHFKFPMRQNCAITWLHRQSHKGWLLNIDGDELLYPSGQSIGEMLASQADDTISVRIRTAESIVPLDNSNRSLFRLPMNRAQRAKIYSEDDRLFGPREGMAGHSVGKSFVRHGVPGIFLRQHWPEKWEVGRLPETVLSLDSGFHLLHNNGRDFGQWCSKVDWRKTSSGFPKKISQRIDEICQGDDPNAALRDLYERIHCGDSKRLNALKEENLLVELDLDLDEPIQRHFGHDAWQRAMEAER